MPIQSLTKEKKAYIGEKPINDGSKTRYHCKRINLDLYLLPCTKINLKRTKDLKLKANMLKPWDKNQGNALQDLGIEEFSELDRIGARTSLTRVHQQMVLQEIQVSEQLRKLPAECRMGKKIFIVWTRMCEELQKFNTKEIELPIKNWTNEQNRQFPKRKQMDKNYFKVFSIPSHWINANLKYFEIPPHSFRMAVVKKSDGRDWRDGSAVKTTSCSLLGPRSDSQHMISNSNSRVSSTLFFFFFFGFHKNQECTQYTHFHVEKNKKHLST